MTVSTAPQWRKSTRSTATGACVEVAALTDGVGVRDSKNTAAGHLTVAHAQWAAFIEGVRTDFA
jgi:hypothetical protein